MVHRYIHLSDHDLIAIVAALRIVPYIDAETDMQGQLNAEIAASVTRKLYSGIKNLTANEIRVVYLGVFAARLLLSGNAEYPFPAIEDIDDALRSELSKFLFTYNRLLPFFQDMVDDMRSLKPQNL